MARTHLLGFPRIGEQRELGSALEVFWLLTGSVTLLQPSFVRDHPSVRPWRCNSPRIRNEVADLEHAGFRVFQVDEPAFREGLPLRRGNWAVHLAWAVRAFRISTGSAADETPVHARFAWPGLRTSCRR